MILTESQLLKCWNISNGMFCVWLTVWINISIYHSSIVIPFTHPLSLSKTSADFNCLFVILACDWFLFTDAFVWLAEKKTVTKKCDPPKSVNKKLANLNQTESLFCMSGRLCAHSLSLWAYKRFFHVKKFLLYFDWKNILIH